ncbi:hypothetical protein M752DRAFT_279345 [Aspergillus phoenicis ATCC 13157]|nr:hypothetical protein M752DRAFT_279345 [Aspergillus phoenicis ATCC 13157]
MLWIVFTLSQSSIHPIIGLFLLRDGSLLPLFPSAFTFSSILGSASTSSTSNGDTKRPAIHRATIDYIQFIPAPLDGR